MLDDIGTLWFQAHDELLPGKSGGGGRSSERTLGLNVVALSFIAGDDILGVLHEWEKLIRQERQLTPPALVPKAANVGAEIHDAIVFAQTHLGWSGTQDWIDDYFKEIKQLHSDGMAAARQFVVKSRRIACPTEMGDGACGNLLKINHDDPLDIFECKRCLTQWTTLRLIAVAMSDSTKEIWLDAEAIGEWLGISQRHVRRLAKQHHIPRRGELYDFNKLQHARKAS